MDKMEILQYVVNIHNRLTQIMVNGDNAILMGDTLKELRALAQTLQKDVDIEESTEVNKQKSE